MGAVWRVFITLLLLLSVSSALDVKDRHLVSLKKDEQTRILVKYAQYTRLFKFRWTLYKNGGLVVFRSYDKEVAQQILYLNHINQSFKLFLKAKGADHYNVPYFLVKFKEFDEKKHEAVFEIFLSDLRNQIRLKYLKKGEKVKLY
jgi:hypothetical protein